MQLSDIKQGRTVYLVSAYPYDLEFHKRNSNIHKTLIVGRPFDYILCGKPEARFRVKNTRYSNDNCEFASTYNIGKINTYNMHAAFLSRRKAESYMKRMASQRLTPQEWARVERIRENHKRMEEFNRMFPVPDYFEPDSEEQQLSYRAWDTPIVVHGKNAVIVMGGV